MRVPGGVLALLTAVCILCIACGCLDTSPPPPSGGGITPVDSPESSTFTEAYAVLDLGADGGLNTTGTSLHRVIGSRVTLDGRADAWLLGLLDGEEARWVAFDIMGWKETSLSAPLPDEELDMTEILSPEDLLALQEEVIRSEMVRLEASTVDIELAEGVYTIAIHSNAGMETLAFRADSGEAIV